MALVLANRVQESATANTTVSFTLTGAVTGFQTFAVIGNTNTTFYSATDTTGNWEVGLGTYSTSGPTLTRTTIYASSNSGSDKKSLPWYFPSPALNATLNGLAGVILVLAYIAIKTGQPKVHGLLMFVAILTSAVFLASYLIYHLLIKEGIATRFADVAPNAPEWVRYLYYFILTTHTILAIAVTPMALWSAWLGAIFIILAEGRMVAVARAGA
jgi:hypothetical protein